MEIEVLSEEAGLRIDKFISEKEGDFSRSFIQKLLKEGNISILGKPAKASYKVADGDIITIHLPEIKETEVLPEDIPLDILYEDSDIIVVNKPKGMVVHPAAGHYSHTLVNALLYHCRDSLSGIGGVLRPGIVHRIDMNTTGALIVCKNDMAHNFLAAQLAEHSITRRYLAIVHGSLKEDGTVTGDIGRHPRDRKKMSVLLSGGKPAVTHYKILLQLHGYTYIECRLETGRTHQIRVHMASIGHPILGDEAYGPKKCPIKGLNGQTLHAAVLGFIHPRTKEYMEFHAPIPDYFQNLITKLQ